ncbi:hypothetical protein E2C01_045034 [Portunus trituberculatus]|uniref:Uncharacterized protein n=1 Tax=Portunus trituberculatus TaxID=210409 RepID=A0A5B7G1R7_PORTR|nr:hypothetical protein [Portunus trituberculatus]
MMDTAVCPPAALNLLQVSAVRKRNIPSKEYKTNVHVSLEEEEEEEEKEEEEEEEEEKKEEEISAWIVAMFSVIFVRCHHF